MTSNRVILLILAVIFLIIVILSSKRIADSLRTRFGQYFPSPFTIQQEAKTSTSPTPAKFAEINQTPIPTVNEQPVEKGGTSVTETPKTGPAEYLWLAIGGSVIAGVILRKVSQKFMGK